ncbi:hypothetical protein EDB80DRAFT_771419 [Ilyonectria destructans]|nr:hypothetical protein EDB80DRAFT_771419 [Ilyonectria destructans]
MQHRPPSTAWEDANKKRRRQIINDGERMVQWSESTDNEDSHARGRQLGALLLRITTQWALSPIPKSHGFLGRREGGLAGEARASRAKNTTTAPVLGSRRRIYLRVAYDVVKQRHERGMGTRARPPDSRSSSSRCGGCLLGWVSVVFRYIKRRLCENCLGLDTPRGLRRWINRQRLLALAEFPGSTIQRKASFRCRVVFRDNSNSKKDELAEPRCLNRGHSGTVVAVGSFPGNFVHFLRRRVVR